MNDGTALTSGANYNGVLGDGTTIDRSKPVLVSYENGNVLTGLKSISSSGSHSIFLKNDGTVLGAGSNSLGQLGHGNN